MSEQDEEGIPVPPGHRVAKAGRCKALRDQESSWLGRGFVKSNNWKEVDRRFALLGTPVPG